MNNIEKQLEQLGIDLSRKGEYVEQCYTCGGFMLRRYAQNKRIASESPVTITAVTEMQTTKTEMKIESGEFQEVYLCKVCEEKLVNGEMIISYGE